MQNDQESKDDNQYNTTSSFEIQAKQKVIDMNKIFTDHFYSKGYNIRNKIFKKDVWFLRGDENFHNQNSIHFSTPKENKPIYEILKNLSDNNNPNKIEIDYTKFIQAICENLYTAQETIKRCQSQIDLYSAHENVSVLEAKLKILEEMKVINNKNYSQMEITINKCDPISYLSSPIEFIMNYSEMNQDDENISENKKLNLKSKCVINIVPMTPSVFKRLSKKENNSYPNLNSNNFTGTSFSDFKLLALKNGELFAESSTEYFLLMLLVYLKELKEIEKPNILFTWKVKMKKVSHIIKNQIENESDQDVFDLTIDFKMNIDISTRMAIFKRIYKILKDAITTQIYNENIKKELLEYFPEISQSILTVLDRKDDTISDNYCLCISCGIF